MLVYVLAVSAALLFAVGTVAQQHAAFEAPPQDVMSLKLLWWLVRRPVWLVGAALAGAGNGLAAAALGRGSVALVEPLLVVRLLFALPLAAAWRRERVPGRDWAGAVLITVGLGLFVAVGRPSQPSRDTTTALGWAVALIVIVALAGTLALIGRTRSAYRRASLLAAGGGLLFATQDALISVAVHLLGHPATLLTTWYPYVVVAAAVSGAVFVQSAYELAPLPASFPVQVTAEPLCGIALGVLVLDGTISVSPVALPLEILGLAVMIVGIFAVARSPLVVAMHQRRTHHLHVPHPDLHVPHRHPGR